MTASLAQKAIAFGVMLMINVAMFVVAPVLGFLAFFVLLPGVFALWRL